MRENVLLIAILLIISSSGVAQKRYAILFGGEHDSSSDIPLLYSKTYDFDQQETIWNDTYLMWELLLKSGFDNDDITVVYHTGQDYVRIGNNSNILAERYDPQIEHKVLYPLPTDNLTKVASTKENMKVAIQDLYNIITEDDYLVLLTYTHGSSNRFHCNNYDQNNSATYVTASNLSSWLAPINCKKLILMQQCFGGSFINELSDDNTIVMTATNEDNLATVADKQYHYYNPSTGQFDYTVAYDALDEFESSYTNNTHKHPHSEWFLHIYTALSGKMPDYSSTIYETGYGNFPLSAADLNSDEFITLNEAHQRALEFDSNQDFTPIWLGMVVGDDPQLSDNGTASKTTIAFTDIITSNITSNKTYKGIIGINKDIHITSGNTLTLGSKARLDFVGDARLIVDAGATLVLNETTIVGNNLNNKVQVYGSLQATNNTIFKTENGNSWGGLVLSSNSSISLNNCSFENVELTGYANSLTVNNCEFSSSYLAFTKGNLTVLNSSFAGTQLRATSPLSASEVIIDNCQVSDYNYSGIYINGYNSYTIQNSTIEDNGYNGIYIHSAGSTKGEIHNNLIKGNGSSSYPGIRIYRSHADVSMNKITENAYGVICYSNSIINLVGQQVAYYPSETQQIVDNNIHQVFSSSSSFPVYFRYNYVNNSNSNAKVYYLTEEPPFQNLDVRYNNWGSFSVDDFEPTGFYNYFPIWFFTLPRTRTSIPEQLYAEGVTEKENGNYTESEKKFKKLVEKYPSSSFALHSLKELMAVAENNKKSYKELKEYLLTEKKIENNKLLNKLAGRLTNRCDVKLKNYEKAIEWFENVIEDPETLEDSVFAIIDLGETYFLMQNDKSSFIGKHAEFKFESVAKFEDKREELLNLLLVHKEDINKSEEITTEKEENEKLNSLTEITNDIYFNVFPNPMREEAQIQYSLNEPSQVLIRVFDHSGKEIKVLVNTYQDKGSYQQIFKANNLSPGIYFYSLELNGQLVKTNKMVIIE